MYCAFTRKKKEYCASTLATTVRAYGTTTGSNASQLNYGTKLNKKKNKYLTCSSVTFEYKFENPTHKYFLAGNQNY